MFCFNLKKTDRKFHFFGFSMCLYMFYIKPGFIMTYLALINECAIFTMLNHVEFHFELQFLAIFSCSDLIISYIAPIMKQKGGGWGMT